MEGIINFLISNDQDAEKLRKLFVFKIVPMMNCDGVINGNSTTGLSGLDYNEEWRNTNVRAVPEICAMGEVLRTT